MTQSPTPSPAQPPDDYPVVSYHFPSFVNDFLPSSQLQDPTWSWPEEAADLWKREPSAMNGLITSLRIYGQRYPVLIGPDRRVWDGHHRVVALSSLLSPRILIQQVPS
jgi:hypothetical protein